MMSITADFVDAPARLPATQRARLRLKSAHRSCGHVQGAWWPHSTRLTAELPELLDTLAPRLGTIARVSYHAGDWSSAPRHAILFGTEVALDTDAESPHTVTVFGEAFGRLTLLVIPPYTEPSEAYATVMAAASSDDVSTPDQLLGISSPRWKTRALTPVALHRWETDGGSIHAVSS
jgi:hypothetical protein